MFHWIRKRMHSILLCAIMVFVLTACGYTTNGEEIPSKSILDRTTVNQEGNGVVLRLYYGTIHNGPMMNAIIADYEEQTGVRIEWTAADSGGLILRGLFATDSAPDLFQLTLSDIPTWVDFIEDLSDQPWVDDVYEFSLNEVSVDHRIYAWPHTLEGSGFVYNKDLFEQAGIIEIPRTLSELVEVVHQLDAAGIQAFGESWMEFGYLAHLLSVPFNYEADVGYISQAILDGRASFGDLRYINEYFDLFDLTMEYGWGQKSLGYNTLDQYPDFAAGKMAMMKQGTWVERSVLMFNENLRIGLFPVPLSEDPELNKLQVSTTTSVAVNRNSEHLEEALAFLNWWHEHAQLYLVEIDRVVPPFRSVDVSVLGALNQDMERYINTGRAFEGFGWEFWPHGFMVQSAEPIQAYAAGLQTREETIRAWDRLYRTLR